MQFEFQQQIGWYIYGNNVILSVECMTLNQNHVLLEPRRYKSEWGCITS